ncbi:hypothetical protein [Botrimarina sp.]|uniref:hypothetical protein n=1 Tax=Botrimarina sp. TaxID=2795802 RepID=UPI0032EEFF9F
MEVVDTTPGDRVVTYVIDSDDRLIDVGEAWSQFAADNEGSDRLQPDSVVGESLWHFIRGESLTELYKLVLRRVRESGQPLEFPYRCDSPGFRRRMRMRVEPIGNGRVGFRSETLSVTPREGALAAHACDSGATALKRCSICNLFRVNSGEWTDALAAVTDGAVLDRESRVQIVWTVCERCRADLRSMLD